MGKVCDVIYRQNWEKMNFLILESISAQNATSSSYRGFCLSFPTGNQIQMMKFRIDSGQGNELNMLKTQ